jgi:membrane protease YdiL (CAAX protease family)
LTKRVGIFYGLTFVLTFVLGGLQEATGIGGSTFILPQWAPGVAGLCMLLLFRTDGMRLPLSIRAADASRLVLALALPLLAAPAIWMLLNLLVWPLNLEGLGSHLSLIGIVGLFFGAVGEELGWRGYLQPLVESRMSILWASVVVGVLWALWHVQSYANGPLYMLFLVLALVGYSLVITALSGFSSNVAVAALFHLSVNVSNLLFLDIISTTRFMAVNAVVWLAMAILVFWLRRRQLLENPKSHMDSSVIIDANHRTA